MDFITSVRSWWIDLKLKTKLTVAFLSIVILAIVILSSTVGYSTKLFFNNYLYNQNLYKAIQIRDYLASFYAYNNFSWEGVERLYFVPPQHMQGQGLGQGRGLEKGKDSRDRIILLDVRDTVLADSEDELAIGEKAPKLEYKTEADIVVNKTKVGKVLYGFTPPPGVVTLEERFSQSVFHAVILAGLGTGLMALALGLYFSRQISVPLVSLANGAQKLAGKDFKYRLHMEGNDEVGLLASSFNTLAEALEKNEQVRNNLVADVAHELRTPVTILRGNLESLQAGVIEPTTENIASLHDEVLRLSRLVNDLQELTLAEAGRLPLNYFPVSSLELVKKVVQSFKGTASAKGIQLNLSLPEKDNILELDEDRMFQVLSNLMSNAIRHTPENKTISISLTEQSGLLQIAITDHGPGISPEDIPFIFDRFYRGSKSRNRADGGAGLGLAISKSLVEAHGGRIELDCPVEGGTRFRVILPLKVPN